MLVAASSWILIEIAYIISKWLCHIARGLEVYLLVWPIQQLLKCHHGPRFHPSICKYHLGGNLKASHIHVSYRYSIQNDSIQRKRGCLVLVFLLMMEETFFRSPPADFSLSFIVKDWIIWPFLHQWLERDLHDWLSHMGMEEILEAQLLWPFIMTVSKIRLSWQFFFFFIKLKVFV